MNLFKLNVGTKVVMGNGRELLITSIKRHTHKHYCVLITFSNGLTKSYMIDGKHHYGTTKHDIVGVVRVKKNSVLRSSGSNNH